MTGENKCIKVVLNKGENHDDFEKLSSTPPLSNKTHYSSISYTESGRSLTEMLGVLAVMGIISVVGVKMFHSAMNRHQANELIYEAQKRATSVAAQIMAGKEKSDLSVAEFPDPEGHTFGVEQNPANPEQFNITITGVSGDVCQKMKTMVGDGTTVRVISEFCDKLTFNNDLSKMGYTTDYDTNEAGCQNAGYTWCAKGNNGASSQCLTSTDCCINTTYDDGCQTCNSTTGEVTNKTDGTSCIYTYADETTAGSTCSAGVCLDPAITTSTKCLTNADCGGVGSGYYCSYSSYDENTFCTADVATAMGCTGQTRLANCGDGVKAGSCTKIGTVSRSNVIGLGQVIVSARTMNWWGADNWCKSQGKKLIDIEDLDIYRSNTTIKVITNSSGSTGCARGKECGLWNQVPYSAMWKGDSGLDARILTDAKDETGELYSAKYSPVLVSLAQQFKGIKDNLWTASVFNNNQCHTFAIYVYSGRADSTVSFSRRMTSSYALCQ